MVLYAEDNTVSTRRHELYSTGIASSHPRDAERLPACGHLREAVELAHRSD